MGKKVKLDMKGLVRLKKRLMTVNGKRIQAGHFDSHPHPNGGGLTIAAIGLLNHEGGTNGKGNVIPARPYIQKAVNMPITRKMLTNIARDIVVGKTHISLHEKKLGRALRDQIAFVIENAIAMGIKENAQFTIDLKGTNAPLQDTLHLIDDLDFKVLKRG